MTDKYKKLSCSRNCVISVKTVWVKLVLCLFFASMCFLFVCRCCLFPYRHLADNALVMCFLAQFSEFTFFFFLISFSILPKIYIYIWLIDMYVCVCGRFYLINFACINFEYRLISIRALRVCVWCFVNLFRMNLILKHLVFTFASFWNCWNGE